MEVIGLLAIIVKLFQGVGYCPTFGVSVWPCRLVAFPSAQEPGCLIHVSKWYLRRVVACVWRNVGIRTEPVYEMLGPECCMSIFHSRRIFMEALKYGSKRDPHTNQLGGAWATN